MNSCVHCKVPNPEGWFYCKNCGNKASESKFTTNLYMVSEIGKRTDVEFSTTTLDEVMKKDKMERDKKNSQFWNNAIKEAKKRYA